MNTTPSSRKSVVSKVAAVVSAMLVAVLGFAPLAAAAPVSVTYDRLGPGYNDAYLTEDAGSYIFTVDGVEVKAFCADVTKAFNGAAKFTVTTTAGSTIPNVGGAGWLAANSSTVGTPDADPNVEDAAVQVAVWALTNGITIDSTTVTYAPVRTRALALVAAVGSNTVAPGPASFNLALTSELSGSNAVFTATLTENGGSPIASQTVKISTPAGVQTLTTDAAGKAVATTPAAAAGASVEGVATFTGAVKAGSLLIPDDGSQPLITATGIPVSLEQRSSVATPAVPVTTAPAPKPQPPTPTTPAPAGSTPVAEELPYTGSAFGVWQLVGAAGVLVVAAAAAVVLRKKNSGV